MDPRQPAETGKRRIPGGSRIAGVLSPPSPLSLPPPGAASWTTGEHPAVTGPLLLPEYKRQQGDGQYWKGRQQGTAPPPLVSPPPAAASGRGNARFGRGRDVPTSSSGIAADAACGGQDSPRLWKGRMLPAAGKEEQQRCWRGGRQAPSPGLRTSWRGGEGTPPAGRREASRRGKTTSSSSSSFVDNLKVRNKGQNCCAEIYNGRVG